MAVTRPRRGVLARHALRDATVPTAIVGLVLLVLASAAVLSSTSLRGRDGAATAHRDLPLDLAGLLGVSDEETLASSVGHLDATFFSLVLPVVLLALCIPLAAKSIAQLVSSGELEFLGGQAITMRDLVVERFVAVVLAATQAALPSVLLVVVAAFVGDLDLGLLGAVLALLRAIAVVAFVAACTVAASALTRSATTAVAVGVGVSLVVFGTSALGASIVSPARWALTSAVAGGGNPLGLVVVVAAALAVVVVAAQRFDAADPI